MHIPPTSGCLSSPSQGVKLSALSPKVLGIAGKQALQGFSHLGLVFLLEPLLNCILERGWWGSPPQTQTKSSCGWLLPPSVQLLYLFTSLV